MKLLDLALKLPEENLALDEALLDACEESGEEVLRFWESESVFAVLGYSNKAEEEVRRDECRAAGVGVFRRASGGGTVLQGPGCLNYSLILRSHHPALDTVTDTNHHVMTRMRVALARHLRRPVTIEGHTDLAIGGLKFSGNAQRRKYRSLLFHGTFLYGFDFEKIERFLKPPPRQPEYRQGRSHRNFVMNLDLDEGTIKSIIMATWNVGSYGRTPLQAHVPREAMQKLVEEKYSKDDWNLKF